MRRQMVIGNWKLHGNQSSVTGLLHELVAGWVGVHDAEVVICPSLVHLDTAYRELLNSNIGLGAQNLSRFDVGAYTGDVSGEMIHDVGCQYVIIGHSERRRYHGETDLVVAKKFAAAQKARLIPIVCVGKSIHAREKGSVIDVIGRQLTQVVEQSGADSLSRSVVVYEPMWAGAGMTPSPEEVQEVHGFIREKLGEQGARARIVYGGSLTPLNAEAFFSMPDVDGALVGSASLNANDFLDICRAADLALLDM